MRELGVPNIDGYNQALALAVAHAAQDGGAERAGVDDPIAGVGAISIASWRRS